MNSFTKNTIWSMFSTVGVQLINTIGNIILARILFPELFGILGMALAIFGLITIFQEAGLSSYLIYKKNISQGLISTSLWLNILCSFGLAIIIVILSPFIADFYKEKTVATLLQIMAVGMIFSGLSITSRTLLVKERSFSKIAKIEMFSECISSFMAILFALNGYDLIAISSRFIIKPFILTVVFLFIKKLSFKEGMQLKYIKKILPYSSKFLGTQVFVYLNNNIDYLIIGKYMGSASLGIYTIAFQWSVMPRYYIAGAVNKVFFPEVSNRKDKQDELIELFLNVVKKVSFFTLPACFGLILIANNFILLFYGKQWMGVVIVLKILLISGAVTSISTLGGSIINGLGRPEIEMKLNIYSFIVLAILIVISSQTGSLENVVWAILLKTIIFDSIKMILVCRLLKIKYEKLVKTILPSLYSVILMYIIGGIYQYLIELINTSILISMLSTIFISIIVYIYFSSLINRELYLEFSGNFKRKVRFERTN